MLTKYRSFIIAFLLGGLLTLTFAPFYYWPLLFVAIGGIFLLLESAKSTANSSKVAIKTGFCLGFCFGFGFFTTSLYWICASLLIDAVSFAWLIPFALTLIPALLACYFAVVFAVFVYLSIRNNYNFWQKSILFSLLWLVAELLRSLLFSGFPWNLLGYTSLSFGYLSQIADLFGVYGVSFLLCWWSLLLIAVKYNSDRSIFRYLATTIISIALSFGYGYYKISNRPNDNKVLNIRLVQANIPQAMKWQEDEKINNLNKYLDLSSKQPNDHLDAVIWPETALPFAVSNLNQGDLSQALARAIPPNGNLITGLVSLNYQQQNLQIFNSIASIDRNSNINIYHKHHLVPFGEYVPLQQYLSFLFLDKVIETITDGAVGFNAGKGPATIVANNFSFSPLICYEVIFSNKAINNKQQPDLFINATNDGWFGNTIGPYQHLAHAQMRAIEYGLPLLRVAGTGISAYINQYGIVVDKIDLQQQGVIDVKVDNWRQQTIYARFGNLLLVILLFCLLLLKKI